MRQRTEGWIFKAESDLRVARRELRVTDEPSFDAVVLHAHQCVEKYLKACLTEWEEEVPRHHELDLLLDLFLPRFPLWEGLRKSLRDLSAEMREARYGPGAFSKSDGQQALDIAVDMRQRCREVLHLPQ